MLAPRPWGLSLSKIRRHKHLLDNFVFILVLCVPHNLDDFIGRVLRLANASRGLSFVVILYPHLRGAGMCIGTRSGRTLGAIATEMSLFAAGETLACLHKLRSFVRGDLPGPDAVDLHRVRVLCLRSQGLLPLFLAAALSSLGRVLGSSIT
jgi:hypothetical protein